MRLLLSIPLLILVLATPAAAQMTCSGWFATCITFCLESHRPRQPCRQWCDNELRTCRVNGCWTRGKVMGSHQHCGLTKR